MSIAKRQGKLFVISGPSGVGKGTIAKRLLDETENIEFSVSMTTRGMREGEVDGVHYYFASEEQFVEMIEDGGFLEHAKVYQNRYGTPKGPVLEKLEKGIDVLLDIEMQGALNVKANYPEAVLIFVLPPSLKTLRERLVGRGTETEESVELRLSNTLKEFTYVEHYDYLVVNDDLDCAVENVKAIVQAEHLKRIITAEELVRDYKEE